MNMVKKTFYEWDLESFDECGDILDHHWVDKCPGIPVEPGVRLVLIRDVAEGLKGLDDTFDLQHRAWAYVENDKLPETFDDGYPVPKRFHKELERAK